MRAIRVSWTETALPGSGTPLPGGGAVTIEWLPIAQVRGDYEAAPAAYRAHYLAPAELPVLTRIAVPKRRVEWLAGRVAAKRLVCLALERAGLPVTPSELAVLGNKPGGRAGKPELSSRTPELAGTVGRHVTDISLAHTLRFAVCALAHGGRVGVDVEPLRSFSPALRRTVFTDHEVALAETAFQAFDSGHRGTALWVVKEALLKAYGIGFAYGWGTARLRSADTGAGVFDITLPAGADPGHRVAVRYGRVTDHIFAIASVAPRPPDGHQQKGQLRAWD
ncbi:4'-phosphopantetheinyl transferase superfamily protein [Streptomyces sp. NPDC006332]|uniref:4'-phosphopantetheinyl transferase family protein n=1 Tax=Streptomyces sp. NPDC006332 TaxID=3155456 RepID=UPI0033BCD142